MAITRKKLCVEAVSRWVEGALAFTVGVSVMHEDGTPLIGLTKSNFKAGNFHEGWSSFPIGSFNDLSGSRGFYNFLLLSPSTDPAAVNLFKTAKKSFTVEVTKDINKGVNGTIFHGQCIVAMNLMEVLELA